VLLGFHFALVAAVGYDYVGLTRGDPVDQLLLHEELTVKYPPEELVMCILCSGQVRRTSHHCMKCDRCTEDFDHHCKFLNNCIGGRNYEAFFRLLVNYVVYNLNLIGQAIWVAVKNF
jgi:palmitoyltransferase